MEQGEMLPVMTSCPDCGLTALELLEDQMLLSVQGVGDDDRDATPISAERYAVQGMNLMFSGVGLDLDHRVEG